MPIDALILAAGEGTRLLPLTRQRPKPLFPILNRPLLGITFNYLTHFSIQKAILNTHHLADQIETFVHNRGQEWPFEITTRFEPEILNTGGGISNIRDFCRSDPFVVINGDILTDIDLQQVIEFHQSHKGPVTLVLHDYTEFNNITVDGQGRIREFRKTDGQRLAFTGIHILRQDLFNHLPPTGSYEIIPIYQQMIQKGIPLWAYVSQGHFWRDIGRPRSYLKIHEELLSGKQTFHFFQAPFSQGGESQVIIHPEAQIEKGAVFSGWASIGKGCRLQKGCHLSNSVLWESVVVPSGVSVSNSVIGSGVHLIRNTQGEVIV